MILITGATGTVGSEVVKRLSSHGVQVRAVTGVREKRTRIGFRTCNSSKATSRMSIRCAGRALTWTGRSC
jgi:nucleoside-diphosphate-sugar epimerase